MMNILDGISHAVEELQNNDPTQEMQCRNMSSMPSRFSSDSMFNTPHGDESTWYLPQCNRENAERLLRGRPDGTFLVRESEKFRGHLVLSLVAGGQIRHCLIVRNSSGYGLIGHKYHPTLLTLVLHHSQIPFYGLANKTCVLSSPVFMHKNEYM